MTTAQDNVSSRVLGQVKWFNNKAGYGFITVNAGENAGKDIFVHFSAITVSNDSQYKYLTQGEYVEFTLDKSSSDNHELQATAVSGINGGKLMCEVRRNNNASYESAERRSPGRFRRYKVAGEEEEAVDGDFQKVQRRKPMRTRAPVKKEAVASEA
jgi:cold shock CspA family protein